jgi:hypothetical protein
MELRKDISKFITQICEKNYSNANKTLESLIEKKLKSKIKKMHDECSSEKHGKLKKKKKKTIVGENADNFLASRLDGISDGGSPYENGELEDIASNPESTNVDSLNQDINDTSDVPMVPLKNLPKGEYFKRKPDSKKVWIKGEYDRFMKKFLCGAFDDISQGMYLKPSTPVYVEFEF